MMVQEIVERQAFCDIFFGVCIYTKREGGRESVYTHTQARALSSITFFFAFPPEEGHLMP